ncbi:hypothetical protein CkaCkLH20_00658 [Colletotrichum karsti]|uniref:GST C-terminal domain-containing protein n=1 Tax=Colletotrichum karsti TaxID=1095194 RepID=A0A9P6IFL2_9PEZI|nr:uncharacterized protein CkaCkLH20_00658 [Colletotrichum karsti]KAF9881512.1 hypothetical protein CkaCkLH20_00658 [Colletotrichum karsti]
MSTPMLTLYRFDGACSLVPHAILAHFNIPFHAVPMVPGPSAGDPSAPGLGLRAADGSLSHADYLKINPTGYVPALATESSAAVITEMPAVLAYIDAVAPHARLFGETPVQRAQVTEWLAWLSGTLHATGFGALWRPARFAETEGARKEVEVKGRAIVDRSFARIDEKLVGREFAVGDGLTAADFNLYVFWFWGNKIGVDMAKVYPNYARLIKMVESLEGVKKMREVEHL